MSGLRRSSRAARKAGDGGKRSDGIPDVHLRADDAEKLRVVLTWCVAGARADDRAAPRAIDGAGAQLRTLLTEGTSLRQIWEHVERARGDARAARPDADATTLLVQHLVAQLAAKYTRDEPIVYAGDAAATSAYALHMRLPTGDYFTNAILLDEERAAALDAGGADLVGVAPPTTAARAPSLGERVGVPAPRSAPHERIEHTTTFLHYGAFGSSLGPAYDSSAATMSAQRSEAAWAASRHLKSALARRWGRGLARLVRGATADDSAASSEAAPNDASELAAAAAALDPELDTDVLASAMDALDTDEALADISDALSELQDLQWLRLRLAYDQTPSPAEAHEQALAADVLAALSAAALHAPPSALHARKMGPLLAVSAAALARSLDGAPSQRTVREHGFWGTLPDTTHGARSKALVSAPGSQAQQGMWATLAHPAAIADNTVAAAAEDAEALSAAFAEHAGAPAAAIQAAFGAPRVAYPPVATAPRVAPAPMPRLPGTVPRPVGTTSMLYGARDGGHQVDGGARTSRVVFPRHHPY